MGQSQNWGRDEAIDGMAAIAQSTAEMGGDRSSIIASVRPYMERFSLTSAGDVREIAAAISRLPQPVDDPAAIRERLGFFEKMLGVTSPEGQLNAALAAREALHSLAVEIEQNQS